MKVWSPWLIWLVSYLGFNNMVILELFWWWGNVIVLKYLTPVNHPVTKYLSMSVILINFLGASYTTLAYFAVDFVRKLICEVYMHQVFSHFHLKMASIRLWLLWKLIVTTFRMVKLSLRASTIICESMKPLTHLACKLSWIQ